MKFAGKFFFALLIAIFAVLVAGYFLAQTPWGTGKIVRWVNGNTGYNLQIRAVSHSWQAPGHIMLSGVTFGRKGHSPTLVAKQVDIGLSARQFSEPMHVDTILLDGGTLNLLPSAAPLPFQAERLQLTNMAINSPETGWNLTAQRVSGGLVPWKPEPGNILGKDTQIQLSAGSLLLNGIPATNVLIQGKIAQQEVILQTVGADIARGALTASARRNSDGSWEIEMLRLNDIRLQTAKSLADFLAPLATPPSLMIDRLEVTGARMEGPQWAVTDLNFSLRNLALANGEWSSNDGQISLNASDIIYGPFQFTDPIFNADLSADGIKIRQFSSRWERGMIRADGEWLRQSHTLALNEVAVAGLEYTLPAQWKTWWQTALPDWLKTVTVGRFSASRNLLIDINPDFPFQFTSLDGDGSGLTLVKDNQWGIWQGKLSFAAAGATFNKVDVRRPSVSLNATPGSIALTELSAFTEKGLLDAKAQVSQTAERALSLQLTGKGVPLDILHNWGWPAVPLSGNGNLQLSLQGRLQAGLPLAPGMNGTLHLTDSKGNQAQQTMHQGTVTGN
ncbi:AsmA family protein [Mangrovibacter yixingensis]|uniref:AsmA family protein n=1 Tax=Mangrovibacter yixingensis TaxID=1529639 RepID=UPI001CFC6203|nr:AsmA family protein [Mangrovibacter yixingensis]